MRKGWSYKLKLLLLALGVFSTLGSGCTDDPEDYTEQPPDVCPSWDTDCDGISNATETNDANAYLNLDPNSPDANPSIAHGQPCNGTLEKGLNLMNEGYGYDHYNIDPPGDIDDWGVLHLINMIEGAGRDWYNNYWPPPRIGVGDLSLRYGGQFGIHSCHQNGTEADFRYVRNDGLEDPLNISTSDSIYFDVSATVALMSYLLDNSNSIKIYLSSYCRGKIIFTEIDTVYDTAGHHDHFHWRIQDPDGTGN